jgi:hypothetical protein
MTEHTHRPGDDRPEVPGYRLWLADHLRTEHGLTLGLDPGTVVARITPAMRDDHIAAHGGNPRAAGIDAQATAERHRREELLNPTAHGPRVGLVACAGVKLDRRAPARDLYVSDLFRKASAYAAATCDEWFILSALHGVVHPDRELDPYNYTLADLPADVRRARVATMATDLTNLLADAGRVELVVLAGANYRAALDQAARTPSWEATVTVPMAGLGIGDQLGWLKRELATLTVPDTPAELAELEPLTLF